MSSFLGELANELGEFANEALDNVGAPPIHSSNHHSSHHSSHEKSDSQDDDSSDDRWWRSDD